MLTHSHLFSVSRYSAVCISNNRKETKTVLSSTLSMIVCVCVCVCVCVWILVKLGILL